MSLVRCRLSELEFGVGVRTSEAGFLTFHFTISNFQIFLKFAPSLTVGLVLRCLLLQCASLTIPPQKLS